jgi:glyoxylase-like metal-dependent hydrolase (beta-lactamase superfamily II)
VRITQQPTCSGTLTGAETGAVFRDAPVFAAGFFAPTEFLVGTGGVYVISDNGWQSAFLVTDEGVIVFDAPASFGKSIPLAISKVTDKLIKMLVYSHSHKDHIGGSAAFKNIKDLKIVALDKVSDFLKEREDPNRLLPRA